MNRSSPNKFLSNSNISPPDYIIATPQLPENCSHHPPNYNLHTNPHNNLFHSQLTPLSSLHIYILLIFLMILIVTIPLMIPLNTRYGNQLNITLLLHHLLKLTISH